MREMTLSEMTTWVFQVNAKLDKVLLAVNSIEKKQTPNSDSEYMGLTEAADFLNKSKSTVYGLVSRGEIPNSKKGKRLLFKRSELQSWIEEGRRKTIHERLNDSENEVIKLNLKKQNNKAPK